MADRPTYRHGQFCWHEIATRDAAAAKAFYSSLFGYTMQDTPVPGEEGTYTMVRLGDGEVGGLYEMAGPQFEGVPAHWMPYVWVDDVDASAAKVESLGGKVMMAPMEIPQVGRMAVAADPAGAAFCLYHGGEHPGAAHVGLADGAVGWNELATPDAAAAAEFYSELFGWSPRRQDVGESVYTRFFAGETPAGGMLEMTGDDWEGIPPHWMPYLNVDDCEGCVSRAESLGGDIQVRATAVEHVGSFAVLKDPAGAVFSIMAWAPEVREHWQREG